MYKKKIIDGYFEREVYYDKHLSLMPNASAGVMVTNYKDYVIYTLRSYSTNILTLYVNVKTGIKALEIGNVSYSRTTMRHVTAFIREYLPGFIDYHFLKDIYKNHDDIMVLRIPDDYKDYNEEEYLYTSDEYAHHFLSIF